ncbi:MAG TPA: carboxypeptidase regulatory-like domain-containing protein [Gemmatimonadales bacterium]
MRTSVVVCAAVAWWSAGGAGPRAEERPPTGRLEGRVILSRDLSTRKPRLRVYSEYGPGAIPAAGAAETSELGNVVVYIDSAVPGSGTPAAPGAALTIEQRNEAFIPHVLPVLVGSTVAFPNRDQVFHNVFSLSSTKTFDLGRFPQNASKSVRFGKAGVVQVFCHIHSDMSAVVLVLPNTHFAVPDSTGHYVIEGVPPGDYRVVAWHERTRRTLQRVNIAAGETTALDFNIPLPAQQTPP